MFTGEVANENVEKLQDLNKREFIMLAILAFGVILLGVYPNPLVDVMHASTNALVEHLLNSKL